MSLLFLLTYFIKHYNPQKKRNLLNLNQQVPSKNQASRTQFPEVARKTPAKNGEASDKTAALRASTKKTSGPYFDDSFVVSKSSWIYTKGKTTVNFS